MLIAVPISCFLVLALCCGALYVNIYLLKSDIADIDSYLQNEDNLQKEERYLQRDGERNSLQARRDNLAAVEAVAASYPTPDRAFFNQLESCSGALVKIDGIQYERAAASLVWNGTASNVSACARYIERVRETGLFKVIGYTGYNADEGDLYFFQVTAVMEEGGGNE